MFGPNIFFFRGGKDNGRSVIPLSMYPLLHPPPIDITAIW